MLNCSCVGSSAANASYDGRKAAVTWFWIFTVSEGQGNQRPRLAQRHAEGNVGTSVVSPSAHGHVSRCT